jgi:hypothetical protein
MPEAPMSPAGDDEAKLADAHLLFHGYDLELRCRQPPGLRHGSGFGRGNDC